MAATQNGTKGDIGMKSGNTEYSVLVICDMPGSEYVQPVRFLTTVLADSPGEAQLAAINNAKANGYSDVEFTCIQGDRPMTNNEFVEYCKNVVADYANKHLDKTDSTRLIASDVYVVWLCKTLQNSKALLSTELSDGMYYELTYNGDKRQLYLDAYKKWENVEYNLDDLRIDSE